MTIALVSLPCITCKEMAIFEISYTCPKCLRAPMCRDCFQMHWDAAHIEPPTEVIYWNDSHSGPPTEIVYLNKRSLIQQCN